MSEKNFYQDSGVTVTNSRFMVNGQMHAMAGITSVRTYVKSPNRLGPIFLIFSGLLGLFLIIKTGIDMTGIIGTALLLGIGVMWFRAQSPTYTILISTAAGESPALVDNNGTRISSIVDALNNAIIHRG